MNLAVQEDAKVKAIRLADALAAIRTQLWPILDTEAIGLSGARGRVLAADLVAKVSLPHWDSAAVDGFAVRGADLVPGRVNRLKVIGEVAAGHPFGGNVGSGQTVRILTGAPLPRRADVVVIQLPGLVVQRSYVGVPSRVLDIMGDGGPSEDIEPVVLREGALNADRARHLVDQTVEGTPFAINVFGAVEVLLDHRRTYDQTTLVHHRLDNVDNPLILGNGAPVCVLHTKLVWVLLDARNEKVRKHGAAVVGLAQDQLDFVLLGNRYQRLQRVVVIAARETASGDKEHPAVKKFQHRVGRLVLSPS